MSRYLPYLLLGGASFAFVIWSDPEIVYLYKVLLVAWAGVTLLVDIWRKKGRP